MPETARLDKLEDSLRKTQDSMLLMSKDVHQMNMSINSIAKSIEALVHIQQDLRVIDERNEQRHLQLKEADKVIHRRLDNLQIVVEEGVKPKTLKGVLTWVSITLVSFGCWVVILSFSNDKEIAINAKEISYLKGRLK
jgi:hypothetical protein